MYMNLTSPMKTRLVQELRDSFGRHPKYSDLSRNIQVKSAFAERPQQGIIVRGVSGSKVQLSAQNFIGTVLSHAMLASVGRRGAMLEWVREDSQTISENGNSMPSAPGVYYLECLSVPQEEGGTGTYVIDPLLTVSREVLLRFETGIETTATLAHVPVEGMLRIFAGRYMLEEGVDYSADYTTGVVTILTSFSPGTILSADYRYPGESIGPIVWRENTADHSSLPGVIMAFGRRASVGDVQAIVVTPDRVDTAEAYGGKLELSFELEVLSRDTKSLEEIVDLVFTYLWAEKRAYLSAEGIEVTDVSMSGEGEEVLDETAQESYYTGNIGVTVSTDWEVHIPLPFTLSKFNVQDKDPLSDGPGFGVTSSDLLYPTFVGRRATFERLL
jgi:hypothetical protein